MSTKILGAMGEKPVTEDDITGLERQLSLSLPSDYRQFLLLYNGGVPEPGAFLIAEEFGYGLVQEFFGFHKDPETSNLEWYLFLENEYFPKDLLRIGVDPGGSYICMSLTPSNNGSIYFWDFEMGILHSGSEEQAKPFFLANDFSMFLLNLMDAG